MRTEYTGATGSGRTELSTGCGTWGSVLSALLPQCGRGLMRESRRAAGGFAQAAGTLPVEHVIAGQRHRLDRLRELNLEYEMAAAAKRQLAADQIYLPHAAEALVVKCADAVAVVLEPAAPGAQRLGVMQPQDLDVGDP